ncbi:DUF423 domain-containing protein [Bizionia gelidisalsuginis]|uniref:DUF423 domain-containing protein n=2 Tax=Bizionia TaxID=283785 RepID=A0A8H2LD29_9FLAO|nr:MULTISPECIES: DUF423 domain-containing protein [Bizionia]TYB70673.1 DUF423 domain-containing protein [Bizionia saleffrena]TYC10199.1 DUF423 domain-containing protein [Bizionia gelidisalsuginis]
MNRKLFIGASVLGLIAVIVGAFAAHGLKPLISFEAIQSFETGVRYQMYHAFLLLFVGGSRTLPKGTKKAVFYLVLLGVFLFSGSIYGLATDTLTAFNFKSIALITPIGGLLLISAWIVMLISFIRIK